MPTAMADIWKGLGFGRRPWYRQTMSGNHDKGASPKAAAPCGIPDGSEARSPLRVPPGGRGYQARLATVALAAGLCLASDLAFAGDYYLRGGIGLDRRVTTAFTDTDCSSATPAALYGCGTGGDGARLRSAGDFGTAPSVELGLGYETGAVRFEVLAEYRPDFSFEGRANYLAPERRQEVSADLTSVSGMLAGFVDLAALELLQPGPFAPFIGAGIGAVHTRIGQTTMTFPATTTIVPGGSRTGLAWMATAGVAVALAKRVSLDLAWRYTDLGEVRTPRGPGRVVWRDGSREPIPLDIAPTKARLKSHGVRLSLRYTF